MSVVCGTVLLVSDIRRAAVPVEELRRNGYGEGDKVQELEVEAEDGKLGDKLTIRVGEQQYTEAQMQDVFGQAAKELEILMLGQNDSPEAVSQDLALLTEIPGRPIAVEWELDRYDLVNVQGEIQWEAAGEALKEEPGGILVSLKAYLTYTEDVTKQAVHEMTVRIVESPRSPEEKLLQSIRESIEKVSNESETKETIKLPKSVEGTEIEYGYAVDYRGAAVLCLGAAFPVLFVGLDRQNRQKEEERRRDQMMRDYPEIVSQMSLLVGAGMSCRSAWERIVEDYRRRRKTEGERCAYEEMEQTWNEMNSSRSERESYERFGARCALQPYRKLAALLSQNVQRGTKGLAEQLRLEGMQAFEDRKAAARRKGEEAGTKLLLPMFFMLTVVLVIVIVPAFLSVKV